MENSRRDQGRKGQPHNDPSGEKKDSRPLTGFEGMNYEQKRKPYRKDESEDKNENRNPGSDSKKRRRDDF
jgi:hypothetical protein